MAVPTIALVTPNEGSTIGSTLIEIYGTNFQLPAIPNTVPVPVQPPAVEVLFDGIPSPLVEVITDGRLLITTPPHAEVNTAGSVGGVDVIVRNLDLNGDVIAGETVTATAAYTYQLPQLYRLTRLQYLVDSFITLLKERINPEVMLNSPSTDWDDSPNDGLSITAIAKFPAIVLNGPSIRESRFYSVNTFTETDLQPPTIEEFTVRREPRTVNIGFEVLLLSNNTQEILNLSDAFTEFMHVTKLFSVPVDISDPTGDTVDIELDFQGGGDLSWATEENDSNVKQMRGSIILRGFDIVDGPFIGKGAPLGAKLGCPDVALEEFFQLDDTVNITGPLKSPPDC